MDLEQLSPAPWMAKREPSSVVNWRSDDCWDVVPLGLVDGEYLDGFLSQPNAEFIALARNAFDVMMRRKIFPIIRCGKWAVDVGQCQHVGGFDDPFTALVEADAWYKANVEAKPNGNPAQP